MEIYSVYLIKYPPKNNPNSVFKKSHYSVILSDVDRDKNFFVAPISSKTPSHSHYYQKIDSKKYIKNGLKDNVYIKDDLIMKVNLEDIISRREIYKLDLEDSAFLDRKVAKIKSDMLNKEKQRKKAIIPSLVRSLTSIKKWKKRKNVFLNRIQYYISKVRKFGKKYMKNKSKIKGS